MPRRQSIWFLKAPVIAPCISGLTQTWPSDQLERALGPEPAGNGAKPGMTCRNSLSKSIFCYAKPSISSLLCLITSLWPVASHSKLLHLRMIF